MAIEALAAAFAGAKLLATFMLEQQGSAWNDQAESDKRGAGVLAGMSAIDRRN